MHYYNLGTRNNFIAIISFPENNRCFTWTLNENLKSDAIFNI